MLYKTVIGWYKFDARLIKTQNIPAQTRFEASPNLDLLPIWFRSTI